MGARANVGLHEHLVERVAARMPDRSLKILDVGCGTGAMLLQLHDLGYGNLVGLDIAPPANRASIEFYEVDLDKPYFPLPARSVQLALAVEVIEHIENVGLLLAEFRRVLAPSGMVILTTPNVHSVEAKLRFLLLGQLKQFDAIGDPTHIYPVFRYPFLRIAARHGFAVAEEWGFPTNGSSPTSRASLRALATFAGLFGARGSPAGDQWCLVLKRTEHDLNDDAVSKKQRLTAHYGSP